MAATTNGILSLLFILTSLSPSSSSSASPYLSSTTLFKNYHNMLTTFKIFIYTPPLLHFTHTITPASLFYNSLLHSPFITQNPIEAHLFFVPFSPDTTSTRSLSRVLRDLRNTHPYWNRTLGADHFFVSPAGIDYSSDRNVLELKKNAIQISVFPVTSGYFVPHKDIALPPFNPSPMLTHPHLLMEHETLSLMGYLKWDGKTQSDLVNELKGYEEFLVEEESEPSDYVRIAKKSKFCLFLYHGDVAWMVDAMSLGCVPVVIVDRPIQDLPLMDVLRWSDLTLLVRGQYGGGRVKEILSGVSEEKYMVMRELGVAASKHLVWNAEAQYFDAFHMVMYQLWLRRHVVRYSRREFA